MLDDADAGLAESVSVFKVFENPLVLYVTKIGRNLSCIRRSARVGFNLSRTARLINERGGSDQTQAEVSRE
jgi:hypothetical protein